MELTKLKAVARAEVKAEARAGQDPSQSQIPLPKVEAEVDHRANKTLIMRLKMDISVVSSEEIWT